jgi:hypothetical protein
VPEDLPPPGESLPTPAPLARGEDGPRAARRRRARPELGGLRGGRRRGSREGS